MFVRQLKPKFEVDLSALCPWPKADSSCRLSSVCVRWLDLFRLNNVHIHRRIAAHKGFILAETLVQNGTAGDNGTAGGTLNQSLLWAAFRPVTSVQRVCTRAHCLPRPACTTYRLSAREIVLLSVRAVSEKPMPRGPVHRRGTNTASWETSSESLDLGWQ